MPGLAFSLRVQGDTKTMSFKIQKEFSEYLDTLG